MSFPFTSTIRSILLCFLFAFNFSLKAQQEVVDSLKIVLSTCKHDTGRCTILYQMIEHENNDSLWPLYNQQLLEISERGIKSSSGELKKFYQSSYAGALSNFGFLYDRTGDIEKSFKYYNQSLRIQDEIGDKQGRAFTFINLGFLHRQQGNVSKALESYHAALKIFIELNAKMGIATSYNNIGYILDNQGEYAEALNYYQKALKMYEELGDLDGQSISYINIGFIYKKYKDPTCTGVDCKHKDLIKAIDCINKSITIREQMGDKVGLAASLNVIGGIYDTYGDPFCTKDSAACKKEGESKALDYYYRALKLREETHNSAGLALSYSSLAEHMYKKGNLGEAQRYAQKCLSISKELGSPEKIKDAARILKLVYEKQNRFKEALDMQELYIQMKDSIFNEDTRKSAIKKGFQIEYEKQAARDSIANASKIKEEKLKHDLEINKQRSYTYGGLIGLGLMVLVAAVSFRAYRNKRKSNIIISRQKLEVEREKQIVEDQKHIIAEKNKEIIDSINYAKHLQEAILPPTEFIAKVLEHNFVLYLPKDIVAGDFYWCEQKDDRVFIAAADSTGHGVPGAMVSVVCSNALNRSLKEFHITDPGKILDKTRDLVLETFEKSTKEVKDGMDISLLCIDKQNRKVLWSGANNPLWYVNEGNITEITANKQPIGKTDNPGPFVTHTIPYAEGTVLYLFTDGYADQFGGKGGKKFKYKQLSGLLVELKGEAMHVQKEKLEQKFREWKGELEQVDDVCIIGIRL